MSITNSKHAGVRQKTTRTKDHHRLNFVVYVEEVYNELCASKKVRKVPVILASAQTDMFRPTAEYRSDNSSGLHCRVILKSNIKRSDCACRHLVQPTALIATRAPQLIQLGPMQFSQSEHKSNKVFRHDLQGSPNRTSNGTILCR